MRKATVLIVEDHAPTRSALAGALDRLGEEAITASNGAEALAVLDYHDDIALLVIGTLAGSGLSAADVGRLASEYRPQLRILFGPMELPDSPASGAGRRTSPPVWASEDLIGRFAGNLVETLSRLRK